MTDNQEAVLAEARHRAGYECLMPETRRIPWDQLPGDGSEVDVHQHAAFDKFTHLDRAGADLAAMPDYTLVRKDTLAELRAWRDAAVAAYDEHNVAHGESCDCAIGQALTPVDDLLDGEARRAGFPVDAARQALFNLEPNNG